VDDTRYDSRFIFHLLRFKADQVKGIAGGAATPIVNKTTFSNVEISAPDLSVQRRIGSILGAYDDLIENNTRRISILEQTAQMLYREWFVYFRFPGYENVKLVGSEVGLIPSGWQVVALDSVVDEIIDYRGKTPKKLDADWADSGVVALSALNVKQGRLVSLEKAKLVSEDLYRRWMKSELNAGDILMTSEAPLGQLYLLTEKERYCLSQRLFSIRANPKRILPSILYAFLSSHYGQEQINARASGTTVLGIRQAELRKVPTLLPEHRVQQESDAILFPLYRQVAILHKKNAVLRNSRDMLLPKLVSGEVSVENFEKEAVAHMV
jgi:type I restriction enzyme S subunit